MLEAILSELLGRPEDSFDTTTDGCQMVNYALSAREIATLYLTLATSTRDQSRNGSQAKAQWYQYIPELRELIKRFPNIIGGSESFDSRLMQGKLKGIEVPLIAKVGADGLLAIGILPGETYKNGLGILIKLSSGYEGRHMEAICRELFSQLGLIDREAGRQPAKPLFGPPVRTDHLQSNFHFLVDNEALKGVVCR